MTAPVRIDRIAAGGDGVGRLADGRVVFIPRTAPGDLVEPTGLRLAARYARARLGTLLEPGPGRVPPRCAHYREDECGGCQLQHLEAGAQRAARRRIAGDALRRIGKLAADDPALEPADQEFGYRARITLAVSDDRRRIGFHPVDRPGEVFDLDRCEIAAEPLNRLWRAVTARRSALPDGLERLTLRMDDAGGLHLVLAGGGEIEPGGAGLDRALAAEGVAVSIWSRSGPGAMRLIAGPGGDAAGSFEQVAPAMGRRVREHALAECAVGDGDVAWDLYAGVGEAGLALAQAGARVESVEVDAEAVAAGRGRMAHPRLTRRVGRVESWLGRLPRPTVVYANPPRTGLGPTVTGALADAAPARIVYVSCDPATLARDLRALAGSYRVTAIRGFDLFPQTAHVETVARLEAA